LQSGSGFNLDGRRPLVAYRRFLYLLLWMRVSRREDMGEPGGSRAIMSIDHELGALESIIRRDAGVFLAGSEEVWAIGVADTRLHTNIHEHTHTAHRTPHTAHRTPHTHVHTHTHTYAYTRTYTCTHRCTRRVDRYVDVVRCHFFAAAAPAHVPRSARDAPHPVRSARDRRRRAGGRRRRRHGRRVRRSAQQRRRHVPVAHARQRCAVCRWGSARRAAQRPPHRSVPQPRQQHGDDEDTEGVPRMLRAGPGERTRD
jgi:hypothetical protein